jgi:hypothetical protein
MTPQELTERIRAFNGYSLPATACMLLGPLILFAFVVAYLLLPKPGAALPFWPIAVAIFGGAILMSLILTKLVARASIRAGLVCPHCHAPLGGYIKYLGRHNTLCPKCGQPIVDSDDRKRLV